MQGHHRWHRHDHQDHQHESLIILIIMLIWLEPDFYNNLIRTWSGDINGGFFEAKAVVCGARVDTKIGLGITNINFGDDTNTNKEGLPSHHFYQRQSVSRDLNPMVQFHRLVWSNIPFNQQWNNLAGKWSNTVCFPKYIFSVWSQYILNLLMRWVKLVGVPSSRVPGPKWELGNLANMGKYL